MDKLMMAHEYAMQAIDTGYVCETETLVTEAWKYAYAMQAEADKRKEKGFPEAIKFPELVAYGFDEWQPDWSAAPEWANWWAMDSDGDAYWHSCVVIPFISNGVFEAGNPQGHTFEAPSFNYQGNWQDSLRKRPEGK